MWANGTPVTGKYTPVLTPVTPANTSESKHLGVDSAGRYFPAGVIQLHQSTRIPLLTIDENGQLNFHPVAANLKEKENRYLHDLIKQRVL